MKTGLRLEWATTSRWAPRLAGSDVAMTMDSAVELSGSIPYRRATDSGIIFTACGS